MEKEKKFARTLVTTALPYANGPVHIGHLAGVYVPADIYVRYLRLKGENVLFVGDKHEGFEDVQGDKVQCTKVMENGQLIIIRDGKRYSVTGVRVQ